MTLTFCLFAGTRTVWPADPLTARICDVLDCLRSDILPCELPTTVHSCVRFDQQQQQQQQLYTKCCKKVFVFLSFNRRRPANCVHQNLEKNGTKLTACVHSQSKSEKICLNFVIPPQPDDVPDINILIWRLYSKAIIQSAFCTYVSEIYFYTFLPALWK